MKAARARVSRMPEPMALTIEIEPWRSASVMPGVPMRLSTRSSSGSMKLASMRRHSTLTGLRPETVRTITWPLLDHEVFAFEQHEAEVAGDIGVLEIGLVVLAGGQDADAAVVPARIAVQRVAEIAEEAGEPMHMHLRIDVGEGARGGDAVLEREAGARRRLRAIAQHPPAAIRTAAEFEGAEMEEVSAGRLDADDRAQEFGIARDQFGRQQAAADELSCRRRCRRAASRAVRRAARGRA